MARKADKSERVRSRPNRIRALCSSGAFTFTEDGIDETATVVRALAGRHTKLEAQLDRRTERRMARAGRTFEVLRRAETAPKTVGQSAAGVACDDESSNDRSEEHRRNSTLSISHQRQTKKVSRRRAVRQGKERTFLRRRRRSDASRTAECYNESAEDWCIRSMCAYADHAIEWTLAVQKWSQCPVSHPPPSQVQCCLSQQRIA